MIVSGSTLRWGCGQRQVQEDAATASIVVAPLYINYFIVSLVSSSCGCLPVTVDKVVRPGQPLEEREHRDGPVGLFC